MVESAARASSSEQGGGGGSGGSGGGGGGGLLLPPGFRFHPTNEEIITSYLLPKFLNPSFVSRAVGEVDLNSCEPRDLPGKATMGEKEWYFFVHKDMKYPTGMRANRATREGYWKATGKDREILSAAAGELVGMKKTLVFYTGRAPRGVKTNWVMHEFRLEGKSRDQTNNNPKDEWVVCKVFNKKGEGKVLTNAAVDNNAEYSAGTTTPNNASSAVDDGDVVGDFLDSMLDPLYFAEYSNSLPVANTTAATTTDANAAAPPPFNEDDYYNYTVPTTAGTGGSFNVMPYYNLTNTASNTQLAAAPMTSSVPTSGGSYMLNPAAHGKGRSSYNVNLHRQGDHQQALMVKALEGVIGSAPDYGVLAKAPAIARTIPQQQTKLGSYDDGGYAYGNYDLADGAAGAMDGRPAPSASAKNFGGRLLHY